MPRVSPYEVRLAPDERARLEAMVYAAEGLNNDEIAARLDTPRQIVSKWRKRFFEEGADGLEERPRGGRPARFSPQRRRRR